MDDNKVLSEIESEEYKYGFTSNVETDVFPPGLNEDIIRKISAIKHEPQFLLEYRLKAFRHWQTMRHPSWALLKFGCTHSPFILHYMGI